MSLIVLQRLYDVTPPFPAHTYLVDRLWPRGISKKRLEGVIWCKNVAPSKELRQWFHSEQTDEHWRQFSVLYRKELEAGTAWQQLLAILSSHQKIVLLYGSKNRTQNHAIILKDFLLKKLSVIN